jgi:FixJ family two-component response regulator
MVAMIDAMHERSARTLVAMAANVVGSRIDAVQLDGNSDCAALVYVIATDWEVRENLRGNLEFRGFNVRCFASVREFLSHSPNNTVGCIIAEVQRETTDYQLQRQVQDDGGPPIIFIGTHLDMPSGIRAIKAGALDFLILPVAPEELYAVVKEAFRCHHATRQRQGELSALKARHGNLTRREREVFALVVQGLLNKQVAGMLAISLVTVQIHRSNTMRKMGARSFADLVCMALKLQILQKDLDSGDHSFSFSRAIKDLNVTPRFSAESY